MQITWLAYNVKENGGRLFSSAASVRYRLIIPAQALSAIGHHVNVMQVGLDTVVEETAKKITGEVLVIPKLVNPDAGTFERMAGLTLDLLRAARENGQRVVVDISDDHFNHPRYGSHFREMVRECDLVVASTPSMADSTRAYTPRPVHAISDPYEGVRQSPGFRLPSRRASRLLWRVLQAAVSGEARPLRVLWFGHGTNFSAMVTLLPQFGRLLDRYAVEVHLVTSADIGVAELCERFNRDYSPACKLRFSPWSVETTWRALEECDLVVIPAQLDDRAKIVKSPNRMVESIWAGRFVCANPVPSYQEFGECAWIGEDIVGGIEWAVRNSREVMRKLKAGQDHVARHYAPEAIARQWEAAFTAASQSSSLPPQRGQPVKLNLGCGHRILPGYVNVDIAESRSDVRPDVLCDLHRLAPFADGTADEVLSVHVVEHFWRWEVADVLKEWMRVLKPGGEMILECPNLLTACEEFLRDPDRASGPGTEGQRTMWVFYGDPRWQDSLMVHRWGYTPHSLARLMFEVGLVNIRQEPAQFKLRDPRDMRVVGQKPV